MKTFGVALLTTSLALAVGCQRPYDVVVRPGSHFSKTSTITLSASADNAIFKPELEKELIRRGFNVISDTVAQIISEEKRGSEAKSGSASTADTDSAKSAAKIEGAEVIEKRTSTHMKSDYIGKIEYLYRPSHHVVSRVNFSIIDLKTGTVVVSLGIDKGRDNREIASEIAKMLDESLNK